MLEKNAEKYMKLIALSAAIVFTTTARSDPPEELIPFQLSSIPTTKNITNLSDWNEKPAGKHGKITTQNGHLQYNGQRIRLFGVNIVGPGAFPTHEEATQISKRLARFGINIVRLHHLDTQATPRGLLMEDASTIDSSQLEKLDYFIYALKEEGIYVDLNLHVGRSYPSSSRDYISISRYGKGMDIFSKELIDLQKDFARNILSHKNAYTKHTYAEDPAIAIIEINNEDGLIFQWKKDKLTALPESLKDELRKQWLDWRLKSRSKDEYVEISDYLSQSKFSTLTFTQQSTWLSFLWDIELKYWTEMRDFIKIELQAKPLLIGTQTQFSPTEIQKIFDVVDDHSYWQHPEFPNGWSDEHWTINHKTMTESQTGGSIPGLAMHRVLGKPFIVSEYNHPAPNYYQGEGLLLIAAYAALQDWDGLMIYSYGTHRKWSDIYINDFFDIHANPLKMITLIPSAAMLRRGDISSATSLIDKKEFLTENDRKSEIISRAIRTGKPFSSNISPATAQLSLQRSVSHATTNDETIRGIQQSVVSDTSELTWSRRKMTVNSENSKILIGDIRQETQLGDIRVRGTDSTKDWAMVTITSFPGSDSTKRTRKLLITAMASTQNSNQDWKDINKTSLGKNWGTPPVLIEVPSISLTLNHPSQNVKAWTLDNSGDRNRAIKINQTSKNERQIEINSKTKSPWFEIEIIE